MKTRINGAALKAELQKQAGNVANAAERMGVTTPTAYNWIKQDFLKSKQLNLIQSTFPEFSFAAITESPASHSEESVGGSQTAGHVVAHGVAGGISVSTGS